MRNCNCPRIVPLATFGMDSSEILYCLTNRLIILDRVFGCKRYMQRSRYPYSLLMQIQILLICVQNEVNEINESYAIYGSAQLTMDEFLSRSESSSSTSGTCNDLAYSMEKSHISGKQKIQKT